MTTTLQAIQQELKAPKSEYNKFGDYNYRTKEKIIEALKPLLKKYDAELTFQDSLLLVGEAIFVHSVATLATDLKTWAASGYALHAKEIKGMQPAQITGATSSYARKDALDALFLLDSSGSIDAMKPNMKVTVRAGETAKVETKPLPYLNMGTLDYTQAVEGLKNKSVSMKDLKERYRIGKTTEATMLQQAA